MNFRSLDDGGRVDLDTQQGQYEYIANYLKRNGASSEVFAALANLRDSLHRCGVCWDEATQECKPTDGTDKSFHGNVVIQSLRGLREQLKTSKVELEKAKTLIFDLKEALEDAVDRLQTISDEIPIGASYAFLHKLTSKAGEFSGK